MARVSGVCGHRKPHRELTVKIRARESSNHLIRSLTGKTMRRRRPPARVWRPSIRASGRTAVPPAGDHMRFHTRELGRTPPRVTDCRSALATFVVAVSVTLVGCRAPTVRPDAITKFSEGVARVQQQA